MEIRGKTGGKVCWGGKRVDSQTTRWALYNIETRREVKKLGGYSCWDNPRAQEAGERSGNRIEEKARALGYEIVRNPW